MPSLNFKKQFMGAVLNGTKHQTIRATRKHPIKVGDVLYLFTGMRTKECLRLRVTCCTRVRQIRIDQARVRIGMRDLTLIEIKALAAADGFLDPSLFVDFFQCNHGLPFTGQLIEWRA